MPFFLSIILCHQYVDVVTKEIINLSFRSKCWWIDTCKCPRDRSMGTTNWCRAAQSIQCKRDRDYFVLILTLFIIICNSNIMGWLTMRKEEPYLAQLNQSPHKLTSVDRVGQLMVIRTDTGHTSSFHALNEFVQIDHTVAVGVTLQHDLIDLPTIEPYPVALYICLYLLFSIVSSSSLSTLPLWSVSIISNIRFRFSLRNKRPSSIEKAKNYV